MDPSSMEERQPRHSSYYNQEGKYGFLYHRLDKENHTTRKAQLLRLGTNSSNSSTLSEDSTMDISLEETEIEKAVEIKRVIKDFKKLLPDEDVAENHPFPPGLDLLAQDLKQSDLYFKFLESEDASSVNSAFNEDLKKEIDIQRASLHAYQEELRGWNEVTEQKKKAVEVAKQTYEAERDVDFSRLHSEDVETLKSYLTPEQTQLLEEPLPVHSEFHEEACRKLSAINSRLDGELKHLQEHFHHARSKFTTGGNLDMSVIDETPRTLFRAIKNQS